MWTYRKQNINLSIFFVIFFTSKYDYVAHTEVQILFLVSVKMSCDKTSSFPNQKNKPSRQDIMLAANVSADLNICSFFADFHIRAWKGPWLGYYCQMADHRVTPVF